MYIFYDPYPDFSKFTARIDGEVTRAKDADMLRRWQKKGLTICSGSITVAMYKDEKIEYIKNNSKTVDKVLKLWDKGYTFKRKEEIVPVKDKLNSTLQDVADAIQGTNAQKAEYFRKVIPYKYCDFLAVDFPSDQNKIFVTAEKYRKKGKPSQISTLFHGTHIRNIPSIIRRGLKPGGMRGSFGRYGGMLGTGIYVGEKCKAVNYSDFIIFEVKVLLGNCKEIEEVERIQDAGNSEYDSLHIGEGKKQSVYSGYLRNEEWVVRKSEQVQISKLICFKK